MKTFIFWKDNNGKKFTYKGVVGGLLWDQFIKNATAGHGFCALIDAKSVAEAKIFLPLKKPTNFKNVEVCGAQAAATLAQMKHP